ncbi:MAG: 5'/3'-nucleotidase SurE [Acidimicrobiales bacterium]
MRILITNDDGVFAPGIAALARGLSDALGAEHEFLVVAPLTDHSGASSAVGRVYEREEIPYETVQIPGLTRVPVYGIDGTPALAVILACIEGFGPRPDLVVSGINHGLNTGRSVLHSGTVGATLTGAQFGVRGLAVSIAWCEEPVPWESPVALAVALVPFIVGLAPASVFNLNVPALPADKLQGLAHGTMGRIGLIRGVRPERTPEPVAGPPVDRTAGVVRLNLRGSGAAAELAELEPGTDAALVADGWASLTPIHGVREDVSDLGAATLSAALEALASR